MQQMSKMTERELVNEIYLVHHQPSRVSLKELDELGNKVLLAHFLHDKETVLMLHRNISSLKRMLEVHFVKEEKELFRVLRLTNRSLGDEELLQKSVMEMVEEHGEITTFLNKLKEETDNFTASDFAFPTMKAVYTKLQELANDLFAHMAKENEQIFQKYKQA